MPSYTPPLRDMQFVMHEVLGAVDELKALPRYADLDANTLNAVLEEGGKFAAEVTQPLNLSGDSEGCTLDRDTHAVTVEMQFLDCSGNRHAPVLRRDKDARRITRIAWMRPVFADPRPHLAAGPVG